MWAESHLAQNRISRRASRFQGSSSSCRQPRRTAHCGRNRRVKIVTIIGARPQFIKAAPVSRTLRVMHTEILVHTGQHYDAMMSDVFFNELGILTPDITLNVGSAPHGAQTGRML